jgi:hypothetical protein
MAVSTISQAGLDAPITLTSPTLTSPTISGTPVMGASVITSGTAQASTSGTSIDFTSIPSWVKRVTVMFSAVSLSGTATLLVQLGTSGGIEATNYNGRGIYINGGGAGDTNLSTGVNFYGTGAASAGNYGQLVFSSFGSNIWTFTGGVGAATGDARDAFVAGAKTLSGTLDRVRITTSNGTDTFDAGSINILYE